MENRLTMISQINRFLTMPTASVNLMLDEAAPGDEFYHRIVRDFYLDSLRRHPRYPVIRKFCHGVALCRLPRTFDEYFMQIEAAGRRNCKKAARLAYAWSPIDYNGHLDDVREIRRSTHTRQGRLSDDFLNAEPTATTNPHARSKLHCYPYFGVLREGRLFAYAGCLVAGEICLIEQIFGHAERQSDGIVPLLIVETARNLIEEYPRVRYYAYGSYFGAAESMQRFKRKFCFEPHRVAWRLGD